MQSATQQPNRLIATLTLLFSMTAPSARGEEGDSLLDRLRATDLNDYAVGLSVSSQQTPYAGAEDSSYLFPYLTTFTDSSQTDDWLLVREGDLGARRVIGDWELGVVGRAETIGLGHSDDIGLVGLTDRGWTVQAAPLIGYRGWPIHVDWRSYFDLFGTHGGVSHNLSLTWPTRHARGYFVPGVQLIRRDDDFMDYYFGVDDAESRFGRPPYDPGAAWSTQLKARWGYALSDRWLLSGDVQLEFLPVETRASPIVDRDRLWSASIGLAYNSRRVFSPTLEPSVPRFEISIGTLRDTIDSELLHQAGDNLGASNIDLEEDLGFDEEATVTQAEAFYRLTPYHRIEASYVRVERDALQTLATPERIGRTGYAAGTRVRSDLTSEIMSLRYSFSLLHDAQKELGFSAGVHLSSLELAIVSATGGDVEVTNADLPMPTVGTFASVSLFERATLGARINLFRMDFDRYEGSMTEARAYLEGKISRHFKLGAAYTYYSLKLSSSDPTLNGSLRSRHHGPALYAALQL